MVDSCSVLHCALQVLSKITSVDTVRLMLSYLFYAFPQGATNILAPFQGENTFCLKHHISVANSCQLLSGSCFPSRARLKGLLPKCHCPDLPRDRRPTLDGWRYGCKIGPAALSDIFLEAHPARFSLIQKCKQSSISDMNIL